LLAGRTFTPLEMEQKLPLAVVDENLTRQLWPNENPIGKKLLRRPRTPEQQWVEVIGVVNHVRANDFRADNQPQLYQPYTTSGLFDMSLVVRTKAEPFTLGAAIKKAVEQLGTERPVHGIRLMNDYVAGQLAETRFALSLIGLLAALALILCLVGLYSVIAYTVSQRTHEIGVRLALGAQGSDVLRLILRQGMTLVMLGVLAGVAGALALTRALTSLLFGVSATDPLTFAIVVLLLSAVALAACYLPARRATKVDPLIALRCE
jgi:putative ABC transport system permease protein